MDTDLKMSLFTTLGALAVIIAFSFTAALNGYSSVNQAQFATPGCISPRYARFSSTNAQLTSAQKFSR